MTNLLKLPTWADDGFVNAIVETPRGSTCKLDYDPELGAFTLAKPLMAGLSYPYDWGFVPSTKAEDGDPLDVLVIHDAQTFPGVVLRCRPVGILESSSSPRARRKGMTACSPCRTARLSRPISGISVISLHVHARSLNSSFAPPTHSKTRSWNS